MQVIYSKMSSVVSDRSWLLLSLLLLLCQDLSLENVFPGRHPSFLSDRR